MGILSIFLNFFGDFKEENYDFFFSFSDELHATLATW
jgi:hypothetical protein